MLSLLKYCVLILVSLSSPVVWAQTPEDIEKKHDLFLIQDRGTNNPEAALANAFEMLSLSEKIQYERGVVLGKLNIATTLCKSGEYEKSLAYLRQMQSHSQYLQTHPDEEFYRLIFLARNYYEMGLPAQAKQAYDQAATVIPQETDPYKRAFGKGFLLTTTYLITDNQNSIHRDEIKAAQIVDSPDYLKRKGDPRIAQLFKKQDKAFLYICFGDHFQAVGKPDSARYYYEASLEELKQAGECDYEVYAYHGLGWAYDSLGNHSRAIATYLQSIESAKRYKLPNDLSAGYLALSQAYRAVGNEKKAFEFRELYTILTDSLEKQKVKGRNLAFLTLLKDHEADLEESRQKNRLTIIGIIGLSILMVSLGIGFFLRYRNQKEQLLTERTQKLTYKEKEAEQLNQQVSQSLKELEEKEQHTQVLQQKVNESFQELVTLAKQNHPNFYARFQEVYPEIHQKLLAISDELLLSELIMCAYIYLDFPTKDIADHTFRSVRTVQNIKYRIRKKLGLDFSEDLYLWMKELLPKNQS